MNDMHFRPTSLISSAVWRPGSVMPDDLADEVATLCRTERDSGELRVNVAAD